MAASFAGAAVAVSPAVAIPNIVVVAAVQKSMHSLAPRCDPAALAEEQEINVAAAMEAVREAAAKGAQIVLLPVR